MPTARHRRIGDWSDPDTGFMITDAVAYIDTLVLFCAHCLPKGELTLLRKHYGRRMIVKPHPVPGRPQARRLKLTIHQPVEATLERLTGLQADRFVVHAVHIAVDFLCGDRRQAHLAAEYLTRGIVQNWRRRGHRSHLEENSRYWKLDSRAPRNIALYGDRLSKTGLGACCHFEMRFTSAAACRRAHIGELRNLIAGVDAMSLLRHEARIVFIDQKQLVRALEQKARRLLPGTQRRRPTITVADIKTHLQRLLPRCLEDESCSLDQDTVADARSQSLFDLRPELRSCLTRRQSWIKFTPTPRWWRWW